MNNVHLVHQRRTPPTKLTFDILLSTPTFHILDPEPRSQVGLVSRLFRQHRFVARQAAQPHDHFPCMATEVSWMQKGAPYLSKLANNCLCTEKEKHVGSTCER